MADVRSIDADMLLDELESRFSGIDGGRSFRQQTIPVVDGVRMNEIENLISMVTNAPTLDYAPVRHGEWVWNGFDGIGWECSLCKHEESREARKPDANYCPNCGAKMDGRKKP